MGAYAAIKFIRLFGAHVTLAFSPQYSINPEIVEEFDKRRPKLFYNAVTNDGMEIKNRTCLDQSR
jgi:hypothetical protein